MTTGILKELITQAEAWPQEDQEELAEAARLIEARRKGTYVMTDDEREGVNRARRGGFVPDAEMEAFWQRFGVK